MTQHSEVVFVGRHVLAGSRVTHVEHIDDGILASWFVVSDDDPGPAVIADDDLVPLHPRCFLDDCPEAEEALRVARAEGCWSA